jgi:hypothetical protein
MSGLLSFISLDVLLGEVRTPTLSAPRFDHGLEDFEQKTGLGSRSIRRTKPRIILQLQPLTYYIQVCTIGTDRSVSLHWEEPTMRQTTNGNRRQVAVIGATGYTGRFVIKELVRRGFTPIAVARNGEALQAADFSEGVIRRQATTDDEASLDSALQGASAVVNAAGPFAVSAEPVVQAALRAKVHYVDVAAEQISTARLFERYDEPAREASIVVLPAMAFFGGLSDLMVTALMKDWESADSIETLIGFDRWHPTQGTRNTIEGKTVGNLIYNDGKLSPMEGAPDEKNWDFEEPVGNQAIIELPFCETVLLARHVKTDRHRNYITKVAVSDVLDPSTPAPKPADSTGRSAQNFVVDVIVARGAEQRRAFTRGRDGYAVTAPLVVEAVDRLLSGQFSDAGAKAPGEIFDAAAVLRSLSPDHAEFKVITP